MAASLEDGRIKLDCLRSCAPLHLRETSEGIYLVGGAAGPLGGDDLLLEIRVESGASLTIRSATASLALPGADGRPSTVTVNARVAAGGSLRWLPEPVIAGRGCHHRILNRVTLDPGATLVWRDELVLGRRGEAPGRVSSRIDLTLGGRPLLRNQLRVGSGEPGWDGPAVLGKAGAVGTLIVVGPELADEPLVPALLGSTAGILPLAGPAAIATALATGALELRALLDRAGQMLAPN